MNRNPRIRELSNYTESSDKFALNGTRLKQREVRGAVVVAYERGNDFRTQEQQQTPSFITQRITLQSGLSN